MFTMYYGAIKRFDIANGEGIRTTLFVSGCRNRCPGCFQPETWDFAYGKPFSDEVEQEILASVQSSSVRGITILGGEPMEPENQAGILPFLRRFKAEYPSKSIWLYTGFTYEELTDPRLGARCFTEMTSEILSLVDILVEGRFIEEKKRLGLRFRGSENQRIIDMALTREQGAPVIWDGCRFDKNYGDIK